jgi:hypothetical protein
MAAKQRLEQIRLQIEKLGRDSLDVVANANRIVLQGIQRLAEQELTALNEYYKSAVDSLKSVRRGDSSIKSLASSQLDLMQETVNRVISNARESLKIIADTRAELARLVDRDDGVLSQKALAKMTAPAQKAIEDVRKAAEKAQKSAAETAVSVKKSLEKEIAAAEKRGRAALTEGKARAGAMSASVRNTVGSVLDISPPVAVVKKAVSARPSPESRAIRATSKAKKHPPRASSDSTLPPKKSATAKSGMPPKKKATTTRSTMPPKRK